MGNKVVLLQWQVFFAVENSTNLAYWKVIVQAWQQHSSEEGVW